jgi:CRISPR system Cascade subunit CasD
MGEFLLFRLYAPLSSWGDIAVGEVRPSFAYPTKSAVLGLVAAACGVRRNETKRLEALRCGYGFAVRVLSRGTPLHDFHTAEVPSQKAVRKRVLATRKDELDALDPKDNPILSTRHYSCDAVSEVALWVLPGAPMSLTEVEEWLKCPQFTLYLGRKACPPALPLTPHRLPATSLMEAFEKARFPALPRPLRNTTATEVFWDRNRDVAPGFDTFQVFNRRDDPIDRGSWLFLEREEAHTLIKGSE